MNLSREVAQKVLTIVDAGLVKGMGKPEPGKLCVEAAVCLALGIPHSDNPPCVGAAVRAYKIRLNDSAWSSDQARARGMRRVAIAQLGSDGIDQNEFRKEVVIGIVRELLPIALRAAAKLNPKKAAALEESAARCAAVKDFESAKAAANAAYAANAAAYAANAAYAAYAANAAYAAYAAANAAAYAANAAAYAAYAAAYAAANAANAAANAANAAAYAANAAARDEILGRAAEIAVQALIKLKSPGCEWLDLCEAA